jgi:CBS domain-containing protein
MSARAAVRLAILGFPDVRRYTPGKADWAAAGLPLERPGDTRLRAADLARRDAPTCTLDDDLAAVRERVRAAGWDTCVVLDADGVVVGRLGRGAIGADDERTVEEAMREGPGTIRPNMPLERIVERLRERELQTAVVTTSDGEFVGVVRRDEAEATLRGD